MFDRLATRAAARRALMCLAPLWLTACASARAPAPGAALRFPYCSAPACARGLAFELGEVERAWVAWRNAHICDAGAGGDGIPAAPSCASSEVCGDPDAFRVWKPDSASTVDEGLGYGLYFAMLFDEQRLFDGLYRFARRAAHLTEDGLTHWELGRCEELRGRGTSSDGELDLTLSLALACLKTRHGAWPASPRAPLTSAPAQAIDYCAEARDLSGRLLASVVDRPGRGLDASGDEDGGLAEHPGWELLPGDEWNLPAEFPRGIVNLSYFDPAALRVLAQLTDTPEWERVMARQYDLLERAQAPAATCAGLPPQWNDYEGACQPVPWQGPVESCAFSFDAGRVAWRQARAATWFGEALPRSRAAVDRLASFFGSVGLAAVRGPFSRDGTPLEPRGAPYFVANAAMAVWAAEAPSPVPSTCGAATGRLVDAGPEGRATAWSQAVATIEPDPRHRYFNHALRLFALLLMSGNDPNLLTRVP